MQAPAGNPNPVYANVPPQVPSQTQFSAEQRPNHFPEMNLAPSPSAMAATPTSANIPNISSGTFELHHTVQQNAHMVQPRLTSHPPPTAGHSRTPSFASGFDTTGSEPLGQKEDRRRRNTAASARFRVKKKEREKGMEKKYNDVMTRNEKLEARLTHLETENVWLRNLITEKSGLSLADKDLSKVLETANQSGQASHDS